jgi:hypothetical protein
MGKTLVYVAGPYSGDIKKNTAAAREVAQRLWNEGYAVICPHTNTFEFEDSNVDPDIKWADSFKKYLTGDFEIISRCDFVVMLPGWEGSKGSCAEFICAHWLGIDVFHWEDRHLWLKEVT